MEIVRCEKETLGIQRARAELAVKKPGSDPERAAARKLVGADTLILAVPGTRARDEDDGGEQDEGSLQRLPSLSATWSSAGRVVDWAKEKCAIRSETTRNCVAVKNGAHGTILSIRS